ncbi:glycerophosphoryl diester phosphodiesterase [Tepidanaerobacter syntrophicus]|uniref:glycerophosphodiester phosphodiesterase n=1 Tax=Tepidanaerobacter syntrophicus TaxID=224999 RepID=UPI001BD68219|nr:glycerophosphodiester phosphodiesterase [Tepidanaerobacter syntrophicus]GLI50742.1 glycerophosphoryl diester phosphodiesterase [Tepidanaerobacter syntrophicus]
MLVIAHRGASGYAPENTLASIRLALKQKCKAIEIDVQLTNDNYLAVCHDWRVDSISNGKGEIKDLTLSQIKSLDAGSWFSEKFAGEKIPILEEVLEILPKKLLLNIELKKKSTDTRNLEEKVIEVLRRYNRIDRVIISSLNHNALKNVQKLDDRIKIAAAIDGNLVNPIDYIIRGDWRVDIYHPSIDYVSRKIVKQFHNCGIKVNCWTINKKEEGEYLETLGVDGIMTNFPDIFL